MTSIFRIGNTGRAFRVRHFASGIEEVFDIRTASSRRYMVVDLIGRTTVKRTDNRKTACRFRSNSPFRRIAIDAVMAELVY